MRKGNKKAKINNNPQVLNKVVVNLIRVIKESQKVVVREEYLIKLKVYLID